MAQTESWYFIDREQQRLMLHTENDGYRAMRHGLEAKDTPVDIWHMEARAARQALVDVLRQLGVKL